MSMLGTAGKCCLDNCHPTLQNTTAKGNENEKQKEKKAKPQNLRNQLFSNTQTTASLDHLSEGVPCLAELHGTFCLKWLKVEQKDAKPNIFSKIEVNASHHFHKIKMGIIWQSFHSISLLKGHFTHLH